MDMGVPGTDHPVALPHDADAEAAVLDFVKTTTSG
jgi:hypothetical protein